MTQPKDKRVGWLADLKVGDEVLFVGRATKGIQKVKKITPTGEITLDYGVRFTPSGSRIGATRFDSTHIRQATPKAIKEAKDELKRLGQIDKLNHADWRKYSAEQIQSITDYINIIGGNQDGNK